MEWILNLKPHEQWAGGLIVIFITAIFGHWFAQRLNHSLCLWREQRNARAAASAIFRAAFTDVLTHLRHSNTCPLDILSPAFPAHDAAVHEFSRFLGFKCKAFLRAWDQYAYHENQKSRPFLEQYASAAQSISEQRRRRQLAIERLEHLLSFAKVA